MAVSAFRPPVRTRVAMAPFGWTVAIVAEVAIFLGIWQLMSGPLGRWNASFFPPPSQIWAAFAGMIADGSLWKHLLFSTENFVAGYLLAAALGVVCGMALGSWRAVTLLAGPLFWTAYSIPKIALQPLLVLWLGFGNAPKILIVFLMAFFPIAINTMEGFATVSPSLLRAGRVFGARRLDLYAKVAIPASLPFVLTGLRLGISRGMVGIVVGELIGGSAGIGFVILRASTHFDMATALAMTVLLVVMANVGMLVLLLAQRRLAPWATETVNQTD